MKTSALVLGCLGLVLLGVVFFAMFGFGSYNKMVSLDEQVKSQWAQVESSYQRRADLIPNLVRTVQGYADFEKSTLQAVVEARARVGQVAAPGAGGDPTSNPQAFQQFEAAQQNLNSALSRLLVVVENYPNLKANQNFLDLQSQLEGTENRINVERGRYNEVAQGYNAYIRRFPAFIIAKMTGFGPKEYFKSAPGSERAPEVQFQTK
jgi:LemA protein